MGGIGIVERLAWSHNGWKGFDKEGYENRNKYGYDYVRKVGIAHEWWNFYEDFDEEHYIGHIETGKYEPKFSSGIIIFVSRYAKNKYYFIGFYGDGEYNKEGFETNKKMTDLIPEDIKKDIKERLANKKIHEDYVKYVENILEGKETYVGKIRGKKKTSTVFHPECYVEITPEDIGVGGFAQWFFTNIEDKKEKIHKILLKAKQKHEEFLKKQNISEKDEKDVEDVIKKIGRIIDKYFSSINTSNLQKKIWLIAPGEGAEYWDVCIENGIICIGWDVPDEYFNIDDYDEFKAKLKNYNYSNKTMSQIWKFLKKVSKGDIVLAKKGAQKVIGVGVIESEPASDPQLDYSIYRKVKWYKTDLNLDSPKTFTQTITEVTPEELKKVPELERIISEINDEGHLDNRMKKKIYLLKSKKQIILYGPPGTGKTFQARRIATSFITGSKDFEEKYKELEKNGQIKFITFHPTYSYEEFVEGYRPKEDGKFELEKGVFKRICIRAARALCKIAGIGCETDNKKEEQIFDKLIEQRDKIQDALKNNNLKKYVLIIDEINRGNISKIFGELITLLEPDKRIGGKSQTIVALPYSKKKFGVPPNLYIIGTMNTADRSIALVDIALRRRFGFVEIPPEPKKIYEVINDELGLSKEEITEKLGGLDFEKLLKAMNMRITFLADREKQIGHAYFLNVFRDENGDYVKDEDLWKENLHRIWYNEIIPLLQEYFYNDYKKIKKVLGEDENGDGFIEKIKTDNTVKDYVPEDLERYDINHENKKLYSENFDEFVKALNKVYEPKSADKTGE